MLIDFLFMSSHHKAYHFTQTQYANLYQIILINQHYYILYCNWRKLFQTLV